MKRGILFRGWNKKNKKWLYENIKGVGKVLIPGCWDVAIIYDKRKSYAFIKYIRNKG